MTLLPTSLLFAAARLDLGFGNPNKTAALFAILAVWALSFACRAKRAWAAWCLWAASAALGVALVHTHSRGGLVALAAGAAVALAAKWRGLRGIAGILPPLAMAAAVAFASFHTGFTGRLAKSAPDDDASVGNRLILWRVAPAMMADAPGGWGKGRAGEAFMNWYQPLGREERYRTLVNSHLTELVEKGWLWRTGYVFMWMFMLGMGGVCLKVRGDPAPLAVWVAFGTAAFFSSVAEEWLIWGAAGLAMATALPPLCRTICKEMRAMDWRPVRIMAVVAALFGAAVLGALVLLGLLARPDGVPPIRCSNGGACVVVGSGEPKTWIVRDSDVIGWAYGRSLREFMLDSSAGAVGVADNVEAVPPSAVRVALCGGSASGGPAILSRFASLREVRVLSPPNPEAWLSARMDGLRVFCGDLSANCPAEDRPGLVVVPGAADYLPRWPDYACR